MVGHVELRTAAVHVQFSPEIREASIAYAEKGTAWEKGQRAYFSFDVSADEGSKGNPRASSNTAKAILINLQPGTTYTYWIYVNRKQEVIATGEVTTQQLWQYRKPAPDFSFIAGSCTHFNEPKYDRPGKPYGADSSIFVTMGKEKADFMLWLGDNWYTRDVDYYSETGLQYRADHFKRQEVLKPLFRNMAHYAIWDDHDYGPNNSDKSYVFKKASRDVFMKTWANPTYGENGEGIYTKFSWNDVDFFLLDDRYFRSNDDLVDSVNGQPNEEKRMWGRKQMEWLKNALLQSNYNKNTGFKVIATGSQVLNQRSPFECLRRFPAEFKELMDFLDQHKINGVVFLTGDRHHSEIVRYQRPGNYTLYDITSSPLTSGISRPHEMEKNNPDRVGEAINIQNYSRVSFTGEKENRRMTVEFLDIKGVKISEWSIPIKELTAGR